jgi:3-methyl-2-oxobutanoate hydroxymethyltransferase
MGPVPRRSDRDRNRALVVTASASFYAPDMNARARITIATLRQWKKERRKFSVLTCYDATTAGIMEQAGIDALLVGDTYAEVCLGHANTLPATVEHMVTIAEAVRRGAPNAFLIGDMPFLSYQVCPKEAIRNAGQFMVRAGCDCVKVEVDRRLLKTVDAMSTAAIPVVAHLGLLPQSVQKIGGYKLQGKRAAEAMRIIEDAYRMVEAGAVALLLEAVPSEVARSITEATEAPVIGIASGPDCDGQVVVMHDMLGYGGGHPPRAVKRYADLHAQLLTAFRAYAAEVADGSFPAPEHTARMTDEERSELERLLRGK